MIGNIKEHKNPDKSKDEMLSSFRGQTNAALIGAAGGAMFFYFRKWNWKFGLIVGAMAGGLIGRFVIEK